MLPSTRSDARKEGAAQYFTGKACPKGHVANRKTSNGECMECRRIHSKKHYSENKEYHRDKTYRWRDANRDEYNAHCSHAHVKRKRARTSVKATTIESMMIRNYYIDAQALTRETGILHHVDHIWPLARGGPHLPWNLQVLPATINQSKGSKI